MKVILTYCTFGTTAVTSKCCLVQQRLALFLGNDDAALSTEPIQNMLMRPSILCSVFRHVI